MRQASHWYDGATAPPAPVTAASARAIELIQADPDLRARLWSNVRRLKDGLRAMGFDVDDTPVPIICLVVGDAENMRRIQRELMHRGIAVAYMAAYSGLGAAGGLRIAVFATHTEEMIRHFLDELRQCERSEASRAKTASGRFDESTRSHHRHSSIIIHIHQSKSNSPMFASPPASTDLTICSAAGCCRAR